jgi:hypothetical protein
MFDAEQYRLSLTRRVPMTAFKYGFFLAASLSCHAVQAAPMQEATQQAPAAQLSVQDERLIRIQARKDIVDEFIAVCGKMYPQTRDKMQKPHDAWVQAQKQDLDKAAIVMMTHTSREDAQLAIGLLGEEHQKLQEWARNDLGMLRDAPPKANDCLNLANKLNMLPSYPQP